MVTVMNQVPEIETGTIVGYAAASEDCILVTLEDSDRTPIVDAEMTREGAIALMTQLMVATGIGVLTPAYSTYTIRG